MLNTDQEVAPEPEEDEDQKRSADGGHEGPSNSMLQKESLIDPGNEHHHHSEKKAAGESIDSSDEHGGDAGGDATDTAEAEPGETQDQVSGVPREDE